MRPTRRGLLLSGAGAALALAVAGRAQAGTRASAEPAAHHFRVAADGSADFASVQEAIDATPDHPDTPSTVTLAPGTYRETVNIPESKTGLILVGDGDDPADTVIVYDNAAGTQKPDGSGSYGTSGSATVTALPDGFTARNLTFANDWLRAEHPEISGTQAVAIKTMGDRSSFDNCRFLGHQDTLYVDTRDVDLAARQYFRGCYVEGDVDFVFGRATAVYQDCELRTLDRDVDFTPYGFAFAPSTSASTGHGYLAVGCAFTSTAPAAAYKLARPWVPSSNTSAEPKLVIRDSELSDGIDAEVPYANMDDDYPWQGFFFREYGNTGPGAEVGDADQRPQLTAAQAAEHTAETYLDGWQPAVA